MAVRADTEGWQSRREHIRGKIMPRDDGALRAGNVHKDVTGRLWRGFPAGKRRGGRTDGEQGVGRGQLRASVSDVQRETSSWRRRVTSVCAAAPTEASASAADSSIGGLQCPARRGPGLPGPGQLSYLSRVR